MLHLEVGLEGGLVGEELHAFLAALEVGTVLLLLGVTVVDFFAHSLQTLKYHNPRSMIIHNHTPHQRSDKCC